MAGQSRYATAAAISQGSFKNTGGNVFLASGEVFADALAGGPAAARRGGPVLLAQHNSIPAETVAELKRLGPKRIFVVGGELTLSSRVETEAAKYADQVVRLSGATRYATAVAISNRFWRDAGVVYVASGVTFPDALSGGALAARESAPILLSGPGSLPADVRTELQRLAPSRIVLLGGTLTLKKAVRNQVARAVPAATVSRLSGKTRYATSAAIARAGWSSTSRAYFASGLGFADALAGVPAAALHGAPLMLTSEECLPSRVAEAADALAPSARVLLGGPLTLDDRAATTVCP
jgi:putative cell wall-binding protein